MMRRGRNRSCMMASALYLVQLLVIATHLALAQDCSSDIAPCSECLTMGCSWFYKGCVPYCPLDVDCISPELENTLTLQQQCAAFELRERDREACNFCRDTCDECVQTPLVSDPNDRCKWFVGCAGTCPYCAPFCIGILGSCGDSERNTCDPPTDQECSAVSNCDDCVRLGCEWWEEGCSLMCPADTDCVFQGIASSTNNTIQELCGAFELRERDSEACNYGNDSCNECVQTPLVSDPNDRCKWFVGCAGTYRYCAPFRNDFAGSCGDQEQNACTPPMAQECNALLTCTECLATGCSWAKGCSPDCPSDVDCAFPELETSTRTVQQDQCDAYELRERDREACYSGNDSCDKCVETPLVSDQGARCKWFVGYAGECPYCAPLCNDFAASCDDQEGNTCDKGGEKGGKKKGKKDKNKDKYRLEFADLDGYRRLRGE